VCNQGLGGGRRLPHPYWTLSTDLQHAVAQRHRCPEKMKVVTYSQDLKSEGGNSSGRRTFNRVDGRRDAVKDAAGAVLGRAFLVAFSCQAVAAEKPPIRGAWTWRWRDRQRQPNKG